MTGNSTGLSAKALEALLDKLLNRLDELSDMRQPWTQVEKANH